METDVFKHLSDYDEAYSKTISWFDTYEKQGYNPKTHQNVLNTRREIRVEYELPLREAYAELVAGFLTGKQES